MRRGFWNGTAMAVIVAALAAAPVEGLVSPPSGRARKLAAKTLAEVRRGRPRKFSRPSRAVTLTLPDDVITALRNIDTDISLAIVRAMEPRVSKAPRSPAEITTCGGDRSVIVVPHNRALGARTGVELVPLSDGRALLSFDDGLSVPEFELRLTDALADPLLEEGDRAVFDALAQILRSTRRGKGVDVQQRSIIVLRRTGPAVERSDERPKPQARGR